MPESEAVCDAGPLIHLGEIGLTDALHVFRRVIVPTQVADEIRMQPRGPGTSLLRQRHVHLTRPSREEQAAADALVMRRLNDADRLALIMAKAREAPLLTDDLDLRDAAQSLDVSAIGTIGLVIRAATTKFVERNEAVFALDRLLDYSSMFITKGLVERAKEALEAK